MPGDPRLIGLGAVAAVLVLLMAFTFWRVNSTRGALQAQVDTQVADSARLARVISLMDQVQARRDTIERKINVIRSVDGRRYVWPHLLDEISRSVPPYTWLTKLSAAEEEEPEAPPPGAPGTPADSAAAAAAAAAPPEPVGPAFTLEGSTGSTQALTRLMKNLEASPMISGVALVTSEQASQAGRTFLRFTLEGRYEQPDSSLIETVPLMPSR